MIAGRGARWMVIALVALCGCSANVLHGLDERGANEATAALERAGIGAQKVADDAAMPGAGASFTVRVATGDATRAVDLLHALGLPRDRRPGFAETYGQQSLIPTASEERARYVNATAGEIEKTLETIDGVVGARVHLALEDADPLALEAKPREGGARAAVLLKARAGATPVTERDVQKLVAGSVAGLDASAVAVVVTAAMDPLEGANAPLAPLGPLRITAGTRPVLIGLLVGALALLALLATLLLILARWLAALERVSEPAGADVPQVGLPVQ